MALTHGSAGQTHRRFGWRAGFALMLVLLALLAGPALPSVEEDEGILARTLQDLLSDAGRDVRIRGFEGALSSRATVREISIADSQGVWVTLSDVVIDWNRAALLNREIDVNEMSAARIDLVRLPVSAPADSALPSVTAREPFSLPELPVSVHVGLVRADVVHLDPSILGQAADVTLIGAATLQGRQGEASFDAHRTDGQTGSFRFTGDFDNATRVLTLDLGLNEGGDGIAATLFGIPGRPALGLTVKGSGPISTFAADIVLSTGDEERVRGSVALVDESPETGVLQGGGFDINLSGDLRPLLVPDLHPFFGARSSLRATGQRSENGDISFPELLITTNAMRVSGMAAISATGLPQRVRVTAGIERGDGERVLLPGTSGAAFIHSATMHITYDEAQSRDWTIRADVDTLDLPDIAIASATLDARGRLNAETGPPLPGDEPVPLFEGVFEFAAQGIDATDPALQQAVGDHVYGLASLNWLGSGQPLDLTGLALEGQTVSLTAYGQIDGLTFDGFSELEAPDLAAFSGLAGRPLGGSALASVRGQANPLTGAMDLTADLSTRDLSLAIPEADAFLAGRAGISLSLRRDTEGTELRGFDLLAGTAEVYAQGRLQPGSSDLSARLTVSDLARLGEGYGGRLALEVMLGMHDGTNRLQLDGSVIDLRLADLPAAGLIGGMFFGANRLRADLVNHAGVTDIAHFTLSGPRLDLSATGQYSTDAPDIAISLNRLDMAALADGGRGALTGSAVMAGDGGTLRYGLTVQGAAPLATGIEAVDTLIGTGVTLELRVTGAADGGLTVDTAHLDAQGLSARVSGQQGADGAAQFVASALLQDIGRLVPGIGGEATFQGNVTRAAGATSYGVDAGLRGPSGLTATARGRVNDDFTVALDLAGQVESVLFNPSIEPASVQGLIRFDGGLNGPPTLDALRMTARLSGARYVLPGAGVAFRDISGSAEIQGLTSRVTVSGESLSGGSATLTGTIGLDARHEADLQVAATGLTVQMPQLFDAQVTGDVHLTGPLATGPRVSGSVTVDQAEIRIPNSPLGRQGVALTGLTHVGEDAASHQTRLNAGIASGTRLGRTPVPLALDLTLNAPGRVYVRGRGLDAELGGTLRLGGTTRDVVPAGSFTLVRGRLDLLGNRFTLTDGSASMIGSFMPFVRLTATTESDGVLTSITLAGQADAPEISFSSVPELPQDEVLARLVFRRSLTTLSPFQAAQLALSVATLTGRAENSVLSRTRAAMGLDDLDFTVDDVGNTRLRAGRHIGDSVYTDLSVDNTGQGEVTINLNLTPSIRLRGRADTDGGSGLGVFFERDY